MRTIGNSRRAAAFAVLRWILTKGFLAEMLPEGPDRAFVQDLVYTVIRRMRPLRKVLGELVPKWPKGELEALLYVGGAQILYMPDVPDFAAVSETVKAAKMCENPSISRVVNGVLRNLIRRREEFERMIASAPLEERESFPTELVRRWAARYGDEGAEQLCKWHNTPAETFIARRDGTFVSLERGKKVSEVAGYDEGEFIVQDPGTALAVRLLDPKPGERILDACAAPGGKTVQIAWRGADVTACEVNPARRRRLEENLKRLRLDAVRIVESLEQAGTDPRAPIKQTNDQTIKQFDKVLVDAPCSNTGVLRRRPDARWNWSVEKMAAVARLQSEILDQAARLVAPGGRLVYSTCSNEPEENEMQVRSFLSRHSDFSLGASDETVPHIAGCDGAYAAVLARRQTEG